MSIPVKEFVMTHVVENISSLKEYERYCSPTEQHFNAPWKLEIFRDDEFLAFFLSCELPDEPTWSIETEIKQKSVSVTGRSLSRDAVVTYENEAKGWGYSEFIKWDEMEKEYLDNGNLTIEVHVKIFKMTGVPRKPLRRFDESTKDFSDVVLVADGKKFYISKLFLASQSPYFEAMFLKQFKESGKSEITLKDVSANDLQNFLELLYGESPIDDDTVDGILKLADMYVAKLAVQKCEQFLIKESEKSLKDKIRMVKLFRMTDLKKSCLSKINTAKEIRAVLPPNTDEMDISVLGALLQKALSLHK